MNEFSHLCGNERYKACDDERTNAGRRRRNGALQGCSFEDNGWQEERQKERFKRELSFNLDHGGKQMNDNRKLKSYDDLPLVLDVADIQRISVPGGARH